MSKNQEYFEKVLKLSWLQIAWINPLHPREDSQKTFLVKTRDGKHRVQYKSNQIHSRSQIKLGFTSMEHIGVREKGEESPYI